MRVADAYAVEILVIRRDLAAFLDRESDRGVELVRLEPLQLVTALEVRLPYECGQPLPHLDFHGHGGVHLDRGPGHLAVALGGVAVADREPSAVVEHRQEQRRAGGQVAGVHVAAVDVRRDRR